MGVNTAKVCHLCCGIIMAEKSDNFLQCILYIKLYCSIHNNLKRHRKSNFYPIILVTHINIRNLAYIPYVNYAATNQNPLSLVAYSLM